MMKDLNASKVMGIFPECIANLIGKKKNCSTMQLFLLARCTAHFTNRRSAVTNQPKRTQHY